MTNFDAHIAGQPHSHQSVLAIKGEAAAQWVTHISFVSGLAPSMCDSASYHDRALWQRAVEHHQATFPNCAECATLVAHRHGRIPRKRRVTRQPSLHTMMRWMDDGVAKAVDGCKVEPDGCCEHGSESWLLRLGLV